MLEMVACPTCGKEGYIDERKEVNGSWPCARHYLESNWSWKIKTQ